MRTLFGLSGFPAPPTGSLLRNGALGAMIRGGGNTLRIILCLADWWDYRHGKSWNDDMPIPTPPSP